VRPLNRLTLLEKTLNAVLFERQQFTYDSNGNQLQTTRTMYTGGIPGTPVITQQNIYDLRNQLIRTVTENGTIVENVYNGDGLRVKKIVNGTATFYLYEYQRVVLEQNSLGDVTGRNIYGTNLLMRTVGVDAFFYMYNAHADVTALLSISGTIIATYYYDTFGNILEQTGSTDNSILFAGYQYDKETGLYYLNARMYDPVTARFMQEDTYTGQNMDPLSLNLYTYCHNEPLMYSDPTGHKDAGMTGSMYGMPASVYYNYHQYTKVWESKKTKAQADAAKKAYFAAQSYSEPSKKLVLDALLDTEFQDAAYEPIREMTVATMIASDKSNLTLAGIENQTMKNILKADLKGQIIDIKTAEPSFDGFLKDCNEHPEPFIIGGTLISLLLAIPTGGASFGAFQGAMLGGGLTLGATGISDYRDNGTIDLKGTDYAKQWLGGAVAGGITAGAFGASAGLSTFQKMAYVGASTGIGNGAYQYITTGKVDNVEMLNNALGGAIVVGATDLVSKGISSLVKSIKKVMTPQTTQTSQTATGASTGVTNNANNGSTYYHVTTEEAAAEITQSGSLGKLTNSWESRVFAFTEQPTQSQAYAAGIGDRAQTVLKFNTIASFEPDSGIVNSSVKNIAVQTTYGQRVPINISNVETVGFMPEPAKWWQFWKWGTS